MRCTKGIVAYRRGGGGGGSGIVDTFDRANGAIGQADNGMTWIQYGATFSVSGNEARMDSASAATQYAVTLDLGDADGYLEVEIDPAGVKAESGNAGLAFRLTDLNNFWRAVFDSGYLFIEKRVSGSFTTVTFFTQLYTDGTVLGVLLAGNDITVYVNDVQVWTGSDSFNSTATEHGLAFSTKTGDAVCSWTLNDFDFRDAQ